MIAVYNNCQISIETEFFFKWMKGPRKLIIRLFCQFSTEYLPSSSRTIFQVQVFRNAITICLTFLSKRWNWGPDWTKPNMSWCNLDIFFTVESNQYNTNGIFSTHLGLVSSSVLLSTVHIFSTIKRTVSRQSSSFCSILRITPPQSLWNLK